MNDLTVSDDKGEGLKLPPLPAFEEVRAAYRQWTILPSLAGEAAFQAGATWARLEAWNAAVEACAAACAKYAADMPRLRRLLPDASVRYLQGSQDASEYLARACLSLRSVQSPCPRGADKPEPTCSNRHQCWEPCGELGDSAEHAVPGRTDPAAIDRVLGIDRPAGVATDGTKP